MPSQYDIDRKLKQLVEYRGNVQYILDTIAHKGGKKKSDLADLNNLEEQRKNIQRIKETLRIWGYSVEGHPDDIDQPGDSDLPTITPLPSRHWKFRVAAALVIGLIALGGGLRAVSGLSVGLSPPLVAPTANAPSVPTQSVPATAEVSAGNPSRPTGLPSPEPTQTPEPSTAMAAPPSLEVVQPTTSPAPPAPVAGNYPCEATVSSWRADTLNIVRNFPDESASLREPIRVGTSVQALQVSGSTPPWYQIADPQGLVLGWIPAEYLALSAGCPRI